MDTKGDFYFQYNGDGYPQIPGVRPLIKQNGISRRSRYEKGKYSSMVGEGSRAEEIGRAQTRHRLGNINQKRKGKGVPDNYKFHFKGVRQRIGGNGLQKSEIPGRGLGNGSAPSTLSKTPPLHITRLPLNCMYPELSSISIHLMPALQFPLTRPLSDPFSHFRQP